MPTKTITKKECQSFKRLSDLQIIRSKNNSLSNNNFHTGCSASYQRWMVIDRCHCDVKRLCHCHSVFTRMAMRNSVK